MVEPRVQRLNGGVTFETADPTAAARELEAVADGYEGLYPEGDLVVKVDRSTGRVAVEVRDLNVDVLLLVGAAAAARGAGHRSRATSRSARSRPSCPSSSCGSCSTTARRGCSGRCSGRMRAGGPRPPGSEGTPMMDYGFTEYQTAIRDLAREIAEKEIRPVAAEYDREAKFPWPVVKMLAETDLFRVYIDEEYGGISDGTPIMNMVIVTEELSKACGGIALSFAGTALGTLPIILSGSEEQKKRWLPDIAAGQAARGLRAYRAASGLRRRRQSAPRPFATATTTC